MMPQPIFNLAMITGIVAITLTPVRSTFQAKSINGTGVCAVGLPLALSPIEERTSASCVPSSVSCAFTCQQNAPICTCFNYYSANGSCEFFGGSSVSVAYRGCGDCTLWAIPSVIATLVDGPPTVPAQECDIPFTYNGTLYEQCATGSMVNQVAPCSDFSVCLLTERRYAICQAPADFVATYAMESITVPTKGSTHVLSINNWIIIQQRLDASLNFNQSWAAYKNGFGTTSASSSFWLGNEAVHQLTAQAGLIYRLRFEMQAASGEWISAEYDTFQVQDGTTNFYRILLTGFSGDCEDSMNYTAYAPYVDNGMMFTTYDVDKDTCWNNCATAFGGGWWYNCCNYANMNGQYSSHFGWWTSQYGPALIQSRMMMKAV